MISMIENIVNNLSDNNSNQIFDELFIFIIISYNIVNEAHKSEKVIIYHQI